MGVGHVFPLCLEREEMSFFENVGKDTIVFHVGTQYTLRVLICDNTKCRLMIEGTCSVGFDHGDSTGQIRLPFY